jgi:tetratricopeptide (TPR) repeat protein
MYNLILSLASALVSFLVFFGGLRLTWYSSLIPGLITGSVVYFLLARRSLKQLEAIVMAAQQEFMSASSGRDTKRMESGLAKLNEAFKLAPWQFLVASQVHAQVGSILYMLQRFDEAKPHLEKSFVRIAQARAMLGALHYRNKDYQAMVKVFDEAVAHNKKDGLLYSTYAWCLEKSGQREKALDVLSKGLVESPSDEKMKANQLALQNKERLRMKAYGQEWYAFHLEPPPVDMVPSHMRGQLNQRKGYRTPRQR